ncbi:purine nucleoside transporter PunC [Salinivibrio sharmensis]|uniref:Bcr/CflA family efflux transporter n=1 Tax=Salinivibrio sharmensis TaxID=390883 RepID=A0ABX3KF92_9GAMM|nr:purine nucleoside transporter PunC [Salinivibrio sharmensis]OOE87584.1 Bcr/CflA family multidrug efflux transporter [Salinivibrio sharmensis]
MNKQVPFMTLLWLAGLSMLGFLATDMYLPAFEAMRLDLATSPANIGLTLSIFLLGMACGQLVYGPLSDRIGRKPALLIGLSLYLVATVVCIFANNIYLLLGARLVQALGACSAAVIWQAVVIDRYEGKLGQKVFATIMPLVALSPALAPLVGSHLLTLYDWRSIFVVLFALGVGFVAFTLREKESLSKPTQDTKIIDKFVSDYQQVFKSKKFIGNMLIFAGCSAAFFAYLTGSPFVMSAMGYTEADIGLSYIPQTIAFVVGGYACRHALNKLKDHSILPWLLKLFVISVVVIFLISWRTDVTNIWVILGPFCFLAAANGAIYPLVVNRALENFKSCSATAAGLLNFLQMMVCFVASAVVSAFAAAGLIAVTTVMLSTCVVVIIGFGLVWHANRQAQTLAAA